MSGEIAIGVLSLIIVFSFAMSQYLINLKLLQLNERLIWFTGSMESHSALMLRLEAKKQGVRTIWWNPEEEKRRTGRKWPGTGLHGQTAKPDLIRVGMHPDDR